MKHRMMYFRALNPIKEKGAFAAVRKAFLQATQATLVLVAAGFQLYQISKVDKAYLIAQQMTIHQL